MSEPFQISEEVKSVIFVAETGNFFRVLDQILKENPQEQLSYCLNSFRENMEEVITTAQLPFQLVGMDLRYSAASLHKQITGQEPNFDDIDDEMEAKVILARLNQLVQRDDIYPKLVLHLKQSTILLWGVFEAFATDLFIALLNSKPELAQKLMNNRLTYKIFNFKELKFEDGINSYLTNKMGDLLIDRHSITSIQNIKDIFNVILPKDEILSKALDNKNLRILNHRRHLIVHKNSVVDKEYLEKTGEHLTEKSQLIVTAQEFNSYQYSVLAAGTALTYGAKAVFMPLSFKLTAIKPIETSISSK